MDSFPTTTIGDLTVSRLVIGTNWFLGYSHCTPSKDSYILDHVCNRKVIADIIEVFLRQGVNTIIGLAGQEALMEGLHEAQDRTGIGAVLISTPSFPITPATPEAGFDVGEVDRILEAQTLGGADVCLPHQSTTDALVDCCTRKVRHGDLLAERIRAHGMIPGLSTHMPESIIYADESGLDVETYVSIYNSAGFLMQIEVDWVNRIIHQAKKPVLTIKPMAAGQLRPLQGLSFAWNTIRDRDMVAVGTMSPREAAEVVELSRGILAQRASSMPLQETRSKESVHAME